MSDMVTVKAPVSAVSHGLKWIGLTGLMFLGSAASRRIIPGDAPNLRQMDSIVHAAVKPLADSLSRSRAQQDTVARYVHYFITRDCENQSLVSIHARAIGEIPCGKP